MPINDRGTKGGPKILGFILGSSVFLFERRKNVEDGSRWFESFELNVLLKDRGS